MQIGRLSEKEVFFCDFMTRFRPGMRFLQIGGDVRSFVSPPCAGLFRGERITRRQAVFRGERRLPAGAAQPFQMAVKVP